MAAADRLAAYQARKKAAAAAIAERQQSVVQQAAAGQMARDGAITLPLLVTREVSRTTSRNGKKPTTRVVTKAVLLALDGVAGIKDAEGEATADAPCYFREGKGPFAPLVAKVVNAKGEVARSVFTPFTEISLTTFDVAAALPRNTLAVALNWQVKPSGHEVYTRPMDSCQKLVRDRDQGKKSRLELLRGAFDAYFSPIDLDRIWDATVPAIEWKRMKAEEEKKKKEEADKGSGATTTTTSAAVAEVSDNALAAFDIDAAVAEGQRKLRMSDFPPEVRLLSVQPDAAKADAEGVERAGRYRTGYMVSKVELPNKFTRQVKDGSQDKIGDDGKPVLACDREDIVLFRHWTERDGDVASPAFDLMQLPTFALKLKLWADHCAASGMADAGLWDAIMQRRHGAEKLAYDVLFSVDLARTAETKPNDQLHEDQLRGRAANPAFKPHPDDVQLFIVASVGEVAWRLREWLEEVGIPVSHRHAERRRTPVSAKAPALYLPGPTSSKSDERARYEERCRANVLNHTPGTTVNNTDDFAGQLDVFAGEDDHYDFYVVPGWDVSEEQLAELRALPEAEREAILRGESKHPLNVVSPGTKYSVCYAVKHVEPQPAAAGPVAAMAESSATAPVVGTKRAVEDDGAAAAEHNDDEEDDGAKAPPPPPSKKVAAAGTKKRS